MEEVINDKHDHTTMQAIYGLWKEQLYCDITIICGDKSIEAHKVVLSSVSDYFKNVFKYESLESKTCEIDRNVLTRGEVLQTIIEYAYTGTITIDGDNVQELLVAASFLQVDFIVRRSESYMADNIELGNVVELVKLGNQYNLCHLLDSACRFTSNHFEELNHSGTVWELTPFDFSSLIRNKWMSVLMGGVPIHNPEAEILKFVGKYLSIASVSHEQFDINTVSTLLKEIHFEDIGKDDVKGVLDVYPIIDCEIVRDALSNSPKPMQTEEEIAESRIYANCNKRLFRSIKYARGGQVNEVIDTFDNKWPGEKDVNYRPRKFRIIIRRWDDRPVVGGVEIQYNNGMLIKYGGRPKKNDKLVSEHMFILEENEVITKVILRSGWLIDSLTFNTNLGQTFGPYGGSGGTERIADPYRIPAYLHSVDGKEVFTQGGYAITFLSFSWVTYYSGPSELLEKLVCSKDDYYDNGFSFMHDSDSDIESNDSDFYN